MAAVRLSTQQITHVIHIADLHIRCGNNEIARVDEYESVFNNFLSDISQLHAVKNNTALCVIAGDIFETKTRTETAGGLMLFSFINKLQQLLPIVIICGNHDFKQSEPDIPDSVDMITTPYQSAKEVRVNYLKETDHYVWGNIGFGLCSVKDTLRAYNTAGVVENLPEFPSPSGFPENVTYRVALFHGTISQSALPTGRSADTVAHGYPLEWFAGYDCVMLGDNHQQQLHTTHSGMHWGYSGSLIQQNFGEPLFGHGYILWDIANNKGTMHHVYNDYGAVTVIDDDVAISPTRKVPYKTASLMPQFPKHPRVRVVGDDSDADFSKAHFKKYGIVPSFVTLKGRHAYASHGIGTWARPGLGPGADTAGADAAGGDGTDLGSGDAAGSGADVLGVNELGSQMNTLSDLNSPHSWEIYMNDQPDKIEDIAEWIHQPSRMMLPIHYNLPQTITDAINTRNSKIQQLLQVHDKCANGPSIGNHRVVLKYMEWDNLMAFGVDNRFDFETMDNKIALLNGANATGKSSFLDVLSIAIYGEPTISRRDFSGTSMTNKIVNDHKEVNVHCGSKLVVSIDDQLFEIVRTYQETTQEDIAKPKMTVVYKYVDTPGEDYVSKSVIAEGSTVVSAWIHKYFGTAEEILMSTILCQSDTTNFFFKTHAEQRSILDKALHLDTISSYVKVMEESINAHKALAGQVMTYRQGMTASTHTDKEVTPEMLDELQSTADAAKQKAQDIQAKKDELLSSIGDMKMIQKASREYDEDIGESICECELALKAIVDKSGAVPVLDKACIAEMRNTYIRLQVEYEGMVESAKTLGVATTDAVTDAVTDSKRDLASHMKTKPTKQSRFSRDHICSRLQEYSKWQTQTASDAVYLGDALNAVDAKAKLVDVKATYTRHSDQYHKLKAYNISEPTTVKKLRKKDMKTPVEEAMQAYLACEAAGGVLPPNPCSYYDKIIASFKTWRAAQPVEWLSDTEFKLVGLRKAEHDVNETIEKYMSNAFISAPTVPRHGGVISVDADEMTTYTLSYLQKAIVPCRPESELNKWKQTYAEWNAVVVPADSCAQLEKQLIYMKLSEEISELSSIECNPDCHVCCKNPGIIRKKALEQQLAELAALGIGEAMKYDTMTALKEAMAIRRTYEDRVEWMTSEISAWDRAEDDIKRERRRLEKLAVVWWTLWDAWDSELNTLKTRRVSIRNDIASILEFNQTYAQKLAAYTDAVACLESAKAYEERVLAWNVAWYSVQRDVTSLEADMGLLDKHIIYLQQYISWSEEFTGVTEDEVLLDAMEAWTTRYEALEHQVAVETWQVRWATLGVELATVASAVAVYDERDKLEDTIALYKRIDAYYKFVALDDELDDALTSKEAAVKALTHASDKVDRLKALHESEKALDTASTELRQRYNKLLEFKRLFVGDNVNDGFKLWVYRKKVLPLIEQEVNRFIGYIDSFTLSIRIRKGNFIYMLNDRGSTPTLDHASGYQRFIVGLAMRVALTRIGAVGQNIKHMFVDEGFVACDALNILKTKEIMDVMLGLGGYKSILLITHLDIIKDIANMRVDVCRPEGSKTSHIRVGLKRKTVPKLHQVTTTNPVTNTVATSLVVKKRGRPSKAAMAAAAAAAGQ